MKRSRSRILTPSGWFCMVAVTIGITLGIMVAREVYRASKRPLPVSSHNEMGNIRYQARGVENNL